jgi:hypothetical protein
MFDNNIKVDVAEIFLGLNLFSFTRNTVRRPSLTVVVNKIPCPLQQRNHRRLSGETKRHVEEHKAWKRNPALVQHI